MRLNLILTSFALIVSFSTVLGQQSKVNELLKKINFKLKVQSRDEGTTEVLADDVGSIVINRTIEPKFHLWKSFNFNDVNMTVELMPTEVVTKFKTYILYFRCKDEKCVRFENDNGLVRIENFGELFFSKKEDAENMKTLFLQLKNASKTKG